MGLMAKVYPMEKAIAPDMEKGLANLMTLAARPAGRTDPVGAVPNPIAYRTRRDLGCRS